MMQFDEDKKGALSKEEFVAHPEAFVSLGPPGKTK
jgi:hypothetical protein